MQEFLRRPVKHRSAKRIVAANDLDDALVHQQPQRFAAVDAANRFDVGAHDRLPIGNDGEGFAGGCAELQFDLAFAQARFRDPDPAGRHIPGAVEGVASIAASIDNLGPYFGALQFRYFGPRPLIEDNSVRSKSTTTFNGRIGYKITPGFTIELEAFNLFNAQSSAIDYYYQSRLPGEGADGQNDIHFHPIESRSVRVTANAQF